MNSPLRFAALFFVAHCFVIFPTAATAQFGAPPGWVTPHPPFKIIGPLYGVGMLDLSVFLLTSEEGHILINTGLVDSTQHIQDNIEALGFDFQDIKILLTMQAHATTPLPWLRLKR